MSRCRPNLFLSISIIVLVFIYSQLAEAFSTSAKQVLLVDYETGKTLFEKMKMIRSLGIKRSSKKHWQYDVLLNGLNFRLTDFQSALGLSQLKKINKFILKRKKISLRYEKEIKNIKQILFSKLETIIDLLIIYL